MGRDVPAARRAVAHVEALLAVGSVVGFALKALPWFDQASGSIVALFVPLWPGAALGEALAARSTTGPLLEARLATGPFSRWFAPAIRPWLRRRATRPAGE